MRIFGRGVKFGRQQRGHPTPAVISNRIDFICTALGIISGWMITASYIPTTLSDIFSGVATMLLIPLLLNIKKYFGVEITEKKIPIEEVAAVKEPEEKK